LKLKVLVALLLAANSVKAAELSREQWSNGFERALSAALCEDNYYFRQCFRVTAAQCEAAVLSAAQDCLFDLGTQIPLVFRTKQQYEDAGKLVGQCAGTTVEIKFTPRKLSSDKCRDPNAWRR
jgi:hypothetical protein